MELDEHRAHESEGDDAHQHVDRRPCDVVVLLAHPTILALPPPGSRRAGFFRVSLADVIHMYAGPLNGTPTADRAAPGRKCGADRRVRPVRPVTDPAVIEAIDIILGQLQRDVAEATLRARLGLAQLGAHPTDLARLPHRPRRAGTAPAGSRAPVVAVVRQADF